MHGKQDDLVPFSMGRELFDKANYPKDSFFSRDDNHMMNFNDELINKIKTFIKKN